MPFSASFARLAAALLLVMALLLSSVVLAADNTSWCADQRAACVDRCADYPTNNSISFDCTDKGATSSMQRAVVCICLDASGKQLGSFNWGAAGASGTPSPGDRSRTLTVAVGSSG